MKHISKKLKTVLAIITMAVLLTVTFQHSTAQEAIKLIDQKITTEFRDNLTFSLDVESNAEIVEVSLFYKVYGKVATSRNDLDITPDKTIQTEFVLNQTSGSGYLPPGTELQYWWKIVDADGNKLKTEKQNLLYLDNRHDWNILENDRLTLYWYKGNNRFGQALFDRSNVALDTLETDMGVALEEPIKIFIYGSHNDLLDAVSTSANEWTGGQAFPTYGIVVLGIKPNNLDWGLGATTHEMTHLVISQATENPFGDLPVWLDEGIATYNQGLDEYRLDFNQEVKDYGMLLTLRTLSSPFSSVPAEAHTSYAQSGLTVEFIINNYGSDKMANLLDIFSEGALYDDALEQALGVDTDGLDNAFRDSNGFPLLETTKDEVAAATQQKEANNGQPEKTTVAENSGIVETAPTAAEFPPQTSDQNSSSAPLGIPCFTGSILFGLGLIIIKQRR